MILIADSSALIALAIVDKLDALEEIFGVVYVLSFLFLNILMINF